MKIKIKVKPEGRKNLWIPTKETLKEFIKEKRIRTIHNFQGNPPSNMLIGANHDVESVLKDIDEADRLVIFTDESLNMGHSLTIITKKEELECYDLGKILVKDLEIIKK